MADPQAGGHWDGGHWDGHFEWPTAGPARTYDLSVRLEVGMPHHPLNPPFSYTLIQKHGTAVLPNGISAAMEMITMGTHVGTHVDALGHVSLNGCVFGGRDALSSQDWHSGVAVGSVEEMPPLVGPGHLIDAELLLGRRLTPADGIGAEELDQWFTGRPEPGPGSVVLLRTGWMRYWHDSGKYLGLVTGLPGMTISGAKWLSQRGIRATGSDTVNYEHRPTNVITLEVHGHNLVERGIPIIEILNLEQLATDAAYEFFFIAAPLRIGGGTGSPIRPLAFVAAHDSRA